MKLILRGYAFNFECLHKDTGAFQIKPPPKRGNHEIALIRPVYNSLVSLNKLDANGDEDKLVTFACLVCKIGVPVNAFILWIFEKIGLEWNVEATVCWCEGEALTDGWIRGDLAVFE